MDKMSIQLTFHAFRVEFLKPQDFLKIMFFQSGLVSKPGFHAWFSPSVVVGRGGVYCSDLRHANQ